MELIWTIIVGFVAGLIARALTPGSGPSGFFMTAVLGIAGSIVATYVGQGMGWYHSGQPAGFVGGIVGAIVLLVIWGFVRKKR